MSKNTLFQKPVISMPMIVILNTLAMIWLGLLSYLQQSKSLLSGIFFLIVYIALSELWQLLGRNMYYNKRQFAIGIYIGKLFISLVLILIIACQSRWMIGGLLLMYELYQALLYRNDFNYLSTIYFPILNAFFKGIVINIILSVSVPFTYTWDSLSIYVIPFLTFFMASTLYQIMYNEKKKRMPYYILFSLTVIAIMCVMLIHAFSSPITWLKLVLFLIYAGALLFVFKKTKTKRLEQEVCISLFIVLSMMTCTFI